MAKTSGSSRGGRGGGIAAGGADSVTTASGKTFTVGENGVTQADVDSIRDLEGISSNSSSAGIAPTGKAPRGMGKEYADRRAIASRIDTLESRITNLQSKINSSRGQKRRGWEDTRNKSLVPELRRVLSASTQIANGPGDWAFKREMINGLIATVQGA